MIKLKDHRGYKRLMYFLAGIVAIVSDCIFVWMDKWGLNGGEFAAMTFASMLIGIAAFFFIKTTYWVIDGFKNPSD